MDEGQSHRRNWCGEGVEKGEKSFYWRLVEGRPAGRRGKQAGFSFKEKRCLPDEFSTRFIKVLPDPEESIGFRRAL